MKVFITNCILANRSGTEVYVLELARELTRRGHEPLVWSPRLGPFADEFRRLGIPLYDSLDRDIPEPDLLHCHHSYETLAALARFPHRPGLFMIHGALSWFDEPPEHPRLLRYLAVDERTRRRLVTSGIDPTITARVLNSVDLTRFRLRRALPKQPRRALLFSNVAAEDTFLPPIANACDRAGLELDVVGKRHGNPTDTPETILGDFDLVFAKSKAAMEAIATGCAVVVLDHEGVGELVTMQNIEHCREWNFGGGLMVNRHDAAAVLENIAKYDADDARRCTQFIRENASMDSMIDQLLVEYDAVLHSWSTMERQPGPDAGSRVLAEAIGQVTPLREHIWELEEELPRLRAKAAWADELDDALRSVRVQFDDVARRLTEVSDDLAVASERLTAARQQAEADRTELRQLNQRLATTRAGLSDLNKQLSDMKRSRVWKATEPMRRIGARLRRSA